MQGLQSFPKSNTSRHSRHFPAEMPTSTRNNNVSEYPCDELHAHSVHYTQATSVKKGAIREIIESMLLKMDVPYNVTPYDQKLHDTCCQRAIEQGYPMSADRSELSLLPFIPSGVIMSATAYTHIGNEATRVFIALYTAFLVYVDDVYERDNSAVRVFIERFVRGEKQLEPVLEGLARFLPEIADHYEPVVANIILTATLNLINASTLEFQTQGMKV